MSINANDILFYLSGGAANTNPTKSFGGEQSNTQLLSGLNALFPNVSQRQAESGHVDYLCIYAVNNSKKDTLYSAKFSLTKETQSGCQCALGIVKQPEVQQLVITTTATKGTFHVRFGKIRFQCEWEPNADLMAQRLQTALEKEGVPDVTVQSLTKKLPNYIFQITLGNRAEPLVEIFKIDLNQSQVAATKRITTGAPINSIAYQISSSIEEPPLITWRDGSLEVGDMLPGDTVPVWIRRTTENNTAALQNDGIAITITGQPNPVS